LTVHKPRISVDQ